MSWTDSCSKHEASVLMMLLVRMLVGCNLAFNLILSPFFREFVGRIRPGFARYLPKSTWAFRHTWLNRLFDQVSKKVKERHTSWCAQGRLRTLTLDGVKDNDGGKVNNVGDVINGFALFVWSLISRCFTRDCCCYQIPSY